MSLATITRLDLAERGIVEAMAVAVPAADISWAFGSPLTADLGAQWINLTPISGLAPETQSINGGATIPNVSSLVYQVPAVVAGDLVGLRVNNVRAVVTVQPGDSSEDARDALLLALAVRLGSVNTATGSGTDQIVITASQAGSLWYAAAIGSLAYVSGVASGVAYSRRVSAILGVQVDCYSRTPSGLVGTAVQMAADATATVTSRECLAILDGYGLAPRAYSAPVNTSATVSGAWESRETLTLSLSMLQEHSEAGSPLASLSLGLVVRDAQGATVRNLSISA